MSPTPDQTALPAPDSTFKTFAKGRWRAWSSRTMGVTAALGLLLPLLGTIWNMHERSRAILTESIKGDLIAAAKVMATTVDPVVHGTIREPAQETSAAYQEQIAKFIKMRPAVDPGGMIKFVYTCIERDGQIHFILDDTPEGDSDHDGIDDKSHIMEPYTEANEALRRVFKTRAPEVSTEPYTDRWGTFLSGYAPVVDSDGRVVAAVGVDLSMKDYDLQIAGVRAVARLSVLGAASISLLAGLAIAKYHRGLTRAFGEMLTLNQAAMAASRAKSDFLAGMSHELRTPLNAIIGHADLLAASSRSDQKPSIKEVQQAADSLLGMISDILDYSSMDVTSLTVNRRPVAVAALATEAGASFAAAAAAKGLTFGFTVDPACPARVMLDVTPVKQVLRHVIGNAVKFTSQGRVSVRVKSEPSGTLRFIIRDTGMGITDDKRARLFEMFDQADTSTTRKHGGTGIGLAICKRLCDAMQGRIWLENTSAMGSEFHVELPAESAPEPGVIWLITKDNLTSILVSNVAAKLGRKIKIVDSAGSLTDAANDLVLIDLGSVSVGAIHAGRVIALNVDESAGEGRGFTEVLPTPMKPADVRRVLESFS